LLLKMAEEDSALALMPLAAALATLAFFSILNLLYTAYSRLTFKPSPGTVQSEPRSLTSRSYIVQIIMTVAVVVGYGVVCASIDNATVAVFSPYEILSIPVGANKTVVKRAYKTLSLKHHPDKGGDGDVFNEIAKAYSALTDPVASKNYELYGHPDGKQTATMSFGMPEWLLNPKGSTAVVLLLMYLGMFVALIVYAYNSFEGANKKAEAAQQSNSVAQLDIQHLRAGLNSKSTHLDILWWIGTTPENLMTAKRTIAERENIKKEREESNIDGPNLNEGGWADDGDEDDAAARGRKIREAEERKAIEKMAGSNTMLKQEAMEGIDDGVIGIEWVRSVLEEKGAWPPKVPCLTAGTPSFMGAMPPGPDGKPIDPLASAPVRRNMIMMIARQHSHALNTHPRLQEAAKANKIDGRYFQESLKFRMKTSLLLEASMRVAMEKQSPELARTVVETVAMYKIGVENPVADSAVKWFRGAVQAQYGPGNVPAILIHSAKIETDGEDEVATNDLVTLSVDIERKHAEAFTKQKVLLCQKQGLDPRVELTKYREGWWIVLSAVEEGKDDQPERLVLIRPAIVQNIDRKRTTITCKFKGPPNPGNYKFRLDVKSQEFLGCDTTREIAVKIIDESEVKPAEFLENKAEEEEEEGKGDEDDHDEEDSSDEEDGDAVLVSSPKNKGQLRKRNVKNKKQETE